MISKLSHRFKNIIRPILVIFLMSFGVKAGAQTAQSADSLYAELVKATTPADSISILHNLYDCFYFSDRKPVLYQIFETAERDKDYPSMLEALFVLASLYQYKPELEAELLEMAKRIPESEQQRALELYIRLRYQATNIRKMSEEERQQKLHQALKNYRDHDMFDKYDRIACLFLICTNLHNSTDSELLLHYLRQLQELVEEFPYEELYVRTVFYTLAINVYIENEMYDLALMANKRMFDLVEQFDRLHSSQGRLFRNYDGTLYNCYHNMLVCGQELTDEEIDMYYGLLKDVVKRNPRIHADKGHQRKSYIFYLMAKKQYGEALPMLKNQLNNNNTKPDLYIFAKLLVKAAQETGDQSAMLAGSKVINSILRERLSTKSDVSLSELQTIYDVEDLKDQNRDLIFENQNIEIAQRKRGIVIMTVIVFVLIGILIWLLNLYVNSRQLEKRLSENNKRLIEERNSLKEMSDKLVDMLDKLKNANRTKSDFVENMSAEIREPLNAIVKYTRLISDHVREDGHPHIIKEYSDMMTVDTDLLVQLVTDILDLPKLENGEISIHKSEASVTGICNFVIGLVRKHVSPDVEIIFANAGQPDIKVITDSKRVEQVLIQILANAAKFTDSGSIILKYIINHERGQLTFTVTDTGVGIPQGMEEKIFERFVKIDPIGQGNGLGLYIGRLLAEMLGGTLSLDSSYHTGARFVFTVPIR